MCGDNPRRLDRFAFHLESSDPEEIENLAADIHTPLKVLDPREPLSLRSTAVFIDGVMSARVASPSGAIFETVQPFDGIQITMPISKALEISRGSGERIKASGSVGTIVRDEELMQARFRPASDIYGVCIAQDELRKFVATLSARPFTQGKWNDRTFDLDTGVGRTLMNLSAAMVEGLSHKNPLAGSELALQSLKNAVLGTVIQCLPEGGVIFGERSSLIPTPRHVRRAIDFIRAHANQVITLADIAAAAQTSPRALQEGFKRFKETTPMTYLRNVRLMRAHEDLLDPTKPRSVSGIAVSWGFFHMGEFSAQYKQVYGRSPSETLALRK